MPVWIHVTSSIRLSSILRPWTNMHSSFELLSKIPTSICSRFMSILTPRPAIIDEVALMVPMNRCSSCPHLTRTGWRFVVISTGSASDRTCMLLTARRAHAFSILSCGYLRSSFFLYQSIQWRKNSLADGGLMVSPHSEICDS